MVRGGEDMDVAVGEAGSDLGLPDAEEKRTKVRLAVA
jgi:hypothetical protein